MIDGGFFLVILGVPILIIFGFFVLSWISHCWSLSPSRRWKMRYDAAMRRHFDSLS